MESTTARTPTRRTSRATSVCATQPVRRVTLNATRPTFASSPFGCATEITTAATIPTRMTPPALSARVPATASDAPTTIDAYPPHGTATATTTAEMVVV